MDNSGYIYIFSNPEYTGLLKIGKSKKNPAIRADQLTRGTGAIGTFKIEWYQEVPAMDIAETFLHFTFRQFHSQKEYFKIDIDKATTIAIAALDNFFALDDKLQHEMNTTENISADKIKELELEAEALALGLELQQYQDEKADKKVNIERKNGL